MRDDRARRDPGAGADNRGTQNRRARFDGDILVNDNGSDHPGRGMNRMSATHEHRLADPGFPARGRRGRHREPFIGGKQSVLGREIEGAPLDGNVSAWYAAAGQDLTQLDERLRHVVAAEHLAGRGHDGRADAGNHRPGGLIVEALDPAHLSGIVEADVLFGTRDRLEGDERMGDAGLGRIFMHERGEIGFADREAARIHD